jgi:hypothetical protein
VHYHEGDDKSFFVADTHRGNVGEMPVARDEVEEEGGW